MGYIILSPLRSSGQSSWLDLSYPPGFLHRTQRQLLAQNMLHATVPTIPRRVRERQTFMSMQALSGNQDYVNSHTRVAKLKLYSMVSCNRRVVPERSQHLTVTNFKLRTSRRGSFNRYNFRRPRGSIATCRPQWVRSLFTLVPGTPLSAPCSNTTLLPSHYLLRASLRIFQAELPNAMIEGRSKRGRDQGPQFVS